MLQIQAQMIQSAGITPIQQSAPKPPIHPPIINVPQLPANISIPQAPHIAPNTQLLMTPQQIQLKIQQINDEILKGLQHVLIQVFNDDPGLLLQASQQLNMPLDQNDQQYVAQIVKKMAQQFLQMSINDITSKIQELHMIQKDIKDSLLNNINQLRHYQSHLKQSQQQQQLQLQRPRPTIPPIQPQQKPIHRPPPVPNIAHHTPSYNSNQSPIHVYRSMIDNAEYIKNQEQAQKIIDQIMPNQISKLVNQQYLNQMITSFGFVKDEDKKSIPVPEERIPLHEIVTRYIQGPIFKTNPDRPEARSELADKLIQIQNFMENHQKFVKKQPINKFHSEFSVFENMALLLCAAKNCPNFNVLRENILRIVQAQLFSKLNSLVRNKSVQQQHQQQHPPPPQQPPVQPHHIHVKTEQPIQTPPMVSKQSPQPMKAAQIEMCDSFKDQIKDLGRKILPQMDSQVLIPCILLIVGLGDKYNLNNEETMRFFQQNIMKIYQPNKDVLHENMEKIFILINTLTQPVLQALKQHQNEQKPRQIMYQTPDQEDRPKFSEYLTTYIGLVGKINAGARCDEEIVSQHYFLSEEELVEILGRQCTKNLTEVIRALAVQEGATQQNVERKVRSNFGFERSETDSEDM